MPDPRQGVFSTTLVVDGTPIALDAHLARLAASARELYGAELPSTVAARALDSARGHALARLRVTAAPTGERTLCVGVDAKSLERSAVLPGAAGAIDLRMVVLDDWPAVHKWVDRATLHALHAGTVPAVPLLVASDGSVRETIRGNVFALGGDGILRTPPADGSILPGVVRAQLIALAREAGREVREQRLSLAEFACASEVFATNAVRGVEPVRSLDGRRFATSDGVTPVLAGMLAGMLAVCWSLRQLG
jgi:para-aminobenzoate synthetase/4-amino-4-deoxychorismate lyase